MLLKLPLFTCQWQVNTVETIELCQIGSYFDFLLCFILGNPLTVSGIVHYTRFFHDKWGITYFITTSQAKLS